MKRALWNCHNCSLHSQYVREGHPKQPPARLAVIEGLDVRDSRVHNYPPHWNGAPSQELLIIRRNHHTGEVSLDPLRWGLIPHFCEDPKGGRKPINAKCETVDTLPSFRDAYRSRRCILPVDGFFEWKAIKGHTAKQPYAIAMKHGYPFGLGGIRENWKDPSSDEWLRTFAIITTDANEMVAEIHDRMPLILGPADYGRWLSDEPAPQDLLRPYPAAPMRMWPIRRASTSQRTMIRRSFSRSSCLLRRPKWTNRRLPSPFSPWNGYGNIGSRSDRCGPTLSRGSHSMTSRAG